MSVKRANIIVDNTNLSQEIRAEWVKLANQYDYQIRRIYLKTSKEVPRPKWCTACSLDTLMEDQRVIPDVVLNTHFRTSWCPPPPSRILPGGRDAVAPSAPHAPLQATLRLVPEMRPQLGPDSESIILYSLLLLWNEEPRTHNTIRQSIYLTQRRLPVSLAYCWMADLSSLLPSFLSPSLAG